MTASDSNLRLCVYCGHDCTGQPRIKDRRGRYMHRSCYAKANPKSDRQPKDAMNALLLDVDEPAAPETTPCENCGMPRPIAATVCTACRYDTALGRVPKEAKRDAKQAGPDAAAAVGGTALPQSIGAAVSGITMADEAKSGSAPSAWLMSAAGAGVAALVCAFAWGGFAYWTGWEIPIAALGVGFVVGCGAVIGARSHNGFMSGLIAGVLTLASLFGGKYLAASWIIDDLISDLGSIGAGSVFYERFDPYNGWMTDEQALAYDVDHTCRRLEHKGQTLDWPTPADPMIAGDLDWYPQDVVERCREKWAAMTPEESAYARYELVREVGLVHTASEAAPAFAMRGVSMDYPRGHSADTAYFAEDYPLEVQSTAAMRWDAMDADEQCDYLYDKTALFDGGTRADMAMSLMLANERPEAYDTVGQFAAGQGSAMRGVRGWAWGMIWTIGSFFVAWGVGSGGKN